jgi:AraC family transcriptional regulator
MNVASSLRKIETDSRRVSNFRVDSLPLRDSGQWTGIRLEEWRNGSSERIESPEVELERHVLSLNTGTPVQTEVRMRESAPIRVLNQPGTLVVLPARIPYSTINSGYFQGLMLAIAPELLVAQRNPSQHVGVDLRPSAGPSDPFLMHAMLALANDVREGCPGGAIFGDSIATAIAAYLVRRQAGPSQRKAVPGTLNQWDLTRVLEYIDDNLMRGILLSDLSEIAHMPSFMFLRAFKRSTGIPPHRFVLMKRVSRARSLIKSTTLPLVEIAFLSGFSSQSHMTNVMRRMTGLSPMALRRSSAK